MDGLTIATFALVVVTLLLVAVGLAQIIAARADAKRERTLNACTRYESESVMEGCARRLRQAIADDTLKSNTITIDLMKSYY